MISVEQIHNAKILIVDDQMLHIRLLQSVLQQGGYKNIHSITDPREVLVAHGEFKPDVILLDLEMPQVDGYQVMEQLKDIRAQEYLPIFVFSEEKGQDVRLKAFHIGATDFVTTPYESLEVLMRMRTMIEARLFHLQAKDQNKILEEKVQERTKELRDTQLDIIRRLARAAEYRDNDTGIHIIRMSHFCAKLGAAVGLNKTQCELFLNASPLHDVGKIGIPDSILLKPGKLTEEEYEIMKTHTTIGAELLSGSDSPLMKMAQIIALTHQEKWDGSGYPKKLKGEEIPLVGRICGVCDVFDALTSKRPYKKPWSVDEAVEEIKKQSGKQFDPRCVDAFLKILPDTRAIYEQYKEDF